MGQYGTGVDLGSNLRSGIWLFFSLGLKPGNRAPGRRARACGAGWRPRVGSRGHTGRVYTRGVHGWKERARTGIVRRGRDVITRRLALRGQLERGELADGVVDVAALLQDGGHVLYRVRGWECLRQYACRMLNGADPGFERRASAGGARIAAGKGGRLKKKGQARASARTLSISGGNWSMNRTSSSAC